jgi:hypothetical protein
MTDFRALCAELVDELHCYKYAHPQHDTDLIDRARAALEVQPEPQGPTDEEIAECLIDAGVDTMEGESDGTGRTYWEGWHDQVMAGVRAVLARWGRPAIEPVSVSERLPGPEDCDAEGQCWLWRTDGIEEFWELVIPSYNIHEYNWTSQWKYTHWLPHWALPVPGVEGGND